jgi:threonine dehydrogenase-like Zn-dependent dehydrogenase
MVAGAKAKGPGTSSRSTSRTTSSTSPSPAAPTASCTSAERTRCARQALTEGYGADVYLEGTGHPSAVGQGLALLRKLGTFVEYSVFKDNVSVDWSVISDDKELDVLGAHLGPHCWPAAIRMIESGGLPMDRICTHQLPLERFKDGLDLVADGSSSIKVSLIPS